MAPRGSSTETSSRISSKSSSIAKGSSISVIPSSEKVRAKGSLDIFSPDILLLLSVAIAFSCLATSAKYSSLERESIGAGMSINSLNSSNSPNSSPINCSGNCPEISWLFDSFRESISSENSPNS